MIPVNGGRSIEERRRGASSKSLRTSDRATFSINVEFLDTCAFHCPGCFVQRKNGYTENDLDALNNIAEQYYNEGYEVDELLLGPTDLFGCRNAEEVILDPKFISLFKYFNAFTFTSTLQSDFAHTEKMMNIIRDNYPKDTEIEIIVVFDMHAYRADDRKYLDTFERNLDLVHDANIIFSFNIHDKGLFETNDYKEISDIVNQKYNCHLKMLPSFFRSQKTTLIHSSLLAWRDELTKRFKDDNDNLVLNNMTDVHFGGFTYFVYIFKNGEMYSTPFVYDFGFDKHESLLVPRGEDGLYNLTDIIEFEQNNIINQYKFASKTSSCESCQYLASCVGKKVLSVMENRDITDCFLPIELMNFTNNIK